MKILTTDTSYINAAFRGVDLAGYNLRTCYLDKRLALNEHLRADAVGAAIDKAIHQTVSRRLLFLGVHGVRGNKYEKCN